MAFPRSNDDPGLSTWFTWTPDLEGMGTRSGNVTEAEIDAMLAIFPHFDAQHTKTTLSKLMSRMDVHVRNSLGAFSARLTEMAQQFSALTARTCTMDTLDKLVAPQPR